MAKHIEVMLMDNVKKLGKSGEIVKVAPGYARNYLFGKGLAAEVTEESRRRLKKLEAIRAARAAEEKKAALEVARKLEKHGQCPYNGRQEALRLGQRDRPARGD